MKIPIYRKDYLYSAYLITTTDLKFEIFEDFVIVDSKINFVSNPQNLQTELFLNGENLELLGISINGITPNYTLTSNGLTLFNLPQSFTFDARVKIYPQKNTSLNGLYKSSGMFCTQCEAHGFRNITYYLDRPDVLSKWSVEIIADKVKYPTQLSNGNFDGKYWTDPHPKPCYLFALVVGDLAVKTDTFTTQEGMDVKLKIFTEHHNIDKTDFAMESLKNAMLWDEERFNLSYDLDNYMIVAVDDFNMGAMENKGLNVFNSSCVLTSPSTATDDDYLRVEAVIAHEYFHNWTGNRITCKDWFQLSLKEGLTVFRDQEFSADMGDREVKRIEDVSFLKSHQFKEDASPLSHPVRPDSYLEMNNFYTLTIYEKGSEIVRMLHTMLGEEKFQRAMKLYVDRFDGEAVEIEDFVKCMSNIKNFDFDKFMLWYQTSGTPKITIKNTNNLITISRIDDRLLPLKYAIFNTNGKKLKEDLLILEEKVHKYDFSTLGDDLIFSWNRNFSAPIIIEYENTIDEFGILAIYDDNLLSRYEAIQNNFVSAITENIDIDDILDDLTNSTLNLTELNALFTMPSDEIIYNNLRHRNPHQLFKDKDFYIKHIAKKYHKLFANYYLIDGDYIFNTTEIAKRRWNNLSLFYLVKNGNFDLAYQQFKNANCMTDKLSSFRLLLSADNKYIVEVIESFYQEFKNDDLVMDKWFSTQASSPTTDLTKILELLKHSKFNLKNPNKVRALLGGWSQNINFHTAKGYEFLTNMIIKLDKINPQIAARLVSNLTNFKQYENSYQNLQKQQLQKIKQVDNLSTDVFELVEKSLN